MTEGRTARIAFIGAGLHATESLYPNIPFIPEFDFVALCDKDKAKAEQAARRFGIWHWFTDVETMLEEIEPDGCCVCGPPAMHHEVGLQVLRRGIPLFVEKPLADSLEGALELAQAAKEHGTWGMVGFMKRFAPANVLAKEFMGSAEFGDLSSLTVTHGCGPYENTRKMLHFNGIHIIDLARFLGGDVERVFAYSSDGGNGNLGIAATGKLEGGGVVQISQNSGHTWEDCYESVYASGSKAAVFVDGSKDVEVISPTARFAAGDGLKLFGFRSRHTVSGNIAFWWAGGHYQRGYWGELSRFARACLGLVPSSPTLEEGVKAHQVIEAILESAACGREVTVSAAPDPAVP